MTVRVEQMRTTPEGYFTVRWGQPEYTDWMDESMSWKETCYIGDWSSCGNVGSRIRRIETFLRHLGQQFYKVAVGQAKHVIHCH